MITGLQAAGDQPRIVDRLAGGDDALFHDIVGADHQRDRLAAFVAGNPDLRNQQTLGLDPFDNARAHEHAGQQDRLGIGEGRAQSHRSGVLVDGHIGKLQAAFDRIDIAIGQDQLHARAAGAGIADRTAGHRGLQVEQLRRRLRDVDIDRVEMLDRGERVGLPGLHQRARRDQRTPDTPGNRRFYAREAQVDLRAEQRSARGHDRGAGLAGGGIGVVGILLADRVGGHELVIALRLQLRRCDRCLGVGQLALRIQDRGAIGRILDHIQHLPGMDDRTLLEQAAAHDARNLRPDIGCFQRGNLARQLGGQRDRRSRGDDKAHRWRRRCGRRCLGATGQSQHGGRGKSQRTNRHLGHRSGSLLLPGHPRGKGWFTAEGPRWAGEN